MSGDYDGTLDYNEGVERENRRSELLWALRMADADDLEDTEEETDDEDDTDDLDDEDDEEDADDQDEDE
jgi:hypothetical protein